MPNDRGNVSGLSKASTIVAIIGGTLGILTTIGVTVAVVVAYFATREQLRSVDCYYYYSSESLSWSSTLIVQIQQYTDAVSIAADAKIRSDNNPGDPIFLADLETKVSRQNAFLKAIEEAKRKAHDAIKEKEKCGYKGLERY